MLAWNKAETGPSWQPGPNTLCLGLHVCLPCLHLSHLKSTEKEPKKADLREWMEALGRAKVQAHTRPLRPSTQNRERLREANHELEAWLSSEELLMLFQWTQEAWVLSTQHGSSQLPVISVPGALTPSSGLGGHVYI